MAFLPGIQFRPDAKMCLIGSQHRPGFCFHVPIFSFVATLSNHFPPGGLMVIGYGGIIFRGTVFDLKINIFNPADSAIVNNFFSNQTSLLDSKIFATQRPLKNSQLWTMNVILVFTLYFTTWLFSTIA